MYDDRCIRIKKRKYFGKVCTNFRGVNVPEDGVQCEFYRRCITVEMI